MNAPSKETELRIGVISDTHGLLRAEALERLRGAHHILHAGDIGAPGIIEALESMAPVTAVRGNVDTGTWAAQYPATQTVTIGSVRIHVLHRIADLSPEVAARDIDVVVYGHSHRATATIRDGVLFLNPGSAGPRRFRLPVTVATLTVAEGRTRPQIHQLLP